MASKSSSVKKPSLQEDEYIHIEGGRMHNLKNVDLSIPRDKLVVITGISGSGKSSLAFDTIYAEGQRRYLESFSGYIRQFLGGLERPDVDRIDGLSPVVSIEQKSTNKNPRSTVGTVTEIYDFLRLLYARIGEAYSKVSGKKMVQLTEEQIIKEITKKFKGKKVVLLAPLVRGRKGHYRELFEQIRKQGYLRARVDGEIVELRPKMQVDRYKIHDIEVVVDRLRIDPASKDRTRQSIQSALSIGKGILMVMDFETEEVHQFSKNLMCLDSGISYDVPSPNTFSFNSPYGACEKCKGLGVLNKVNVEQLIPDAKISIANGGILPIGEYRDTYMFRKLKSFAKKNGFHITDPIQKIPKKALNQILFGTQAVKESEDVTIESDQVDRWYNLNNGVVGMLYGAFNSTNSDGVRQWAEGFMKTESCDHCDGYRLKEDSLHFKLGKKHIGELAEQDISMLADWFEQLPGKLNKKQQTIAHDLLKEIKARISFLLDVGLDYLSLNRPARSLSGGEAQRIRLATQIGSQLTGVTYILDEPSIGLHQRDNQRLIHSLKDLAEAGNSVLVVEHDKDIMLASDYIIDIGPGAGKFGGEIVGAGKPSAFVKSKTHTAQFLNGKESIPTPKKRRKGNGKKLTLKGAKGNNLKNVSAQFPLGTLICVTGVSGSGKSSLITETLYPILRKHFYQSRQEPLSFSSVKGLEHLDKVIEIDQSPIGRTPRSNPATYIKVFDEIRRLFSDTPEAQIRGYKPGRFSFNVKGGRCEECQGGGMKVVEMNFLPNVHVRCEKCLGKRYNRETLEVRYKGKSISDVLNMSIDEAVVFFENLPKIYRKLKTLQEVGLGYLTLGQSSTTISGGEAQRVKLSAELSKKDTGQTFYILDEPTTGLHFADIKLLLNVLNALVERGNTVLVIEHNLDVVKVADHIIDIGPEGGKHGGIIVANGTPEEIVKKEKSITGKFLKMEL